MDTTDHRLPVLGCLFLIQALEKPSLQSFATRETSAKNFLIGKPSSWRCGQDFLEGCILPSVDFGPLVRHHKHLKPFRLKVLAGQGQGSDARLQVGILIRESISRGFLIWYRSGLHQFRGCPHSDEAVEGIQALSQILFGISWCNPREPDRLAASAVCPLATCTRPGARRSM
jgi:hypothetical protein